MAQPDWEDMAAVAAREAQGVVALGELLEFIARRWLELEDAS